MAKSLHALADRLRRAHRAHARDALHEGALLGAEHVLRGLLGRAHRDLPALRQEADVGDVGRARHRRGVLLVFGAEHVHRDHHARLGLQRRGTETAAVGRDDARVELRVDEQRHGVGQSEFGREQRAVGAGAQHPHRDATDRHGSHARTEVRVPQRLGERVQQLREALELRATVGGERDGRVHVGPRCAADAEVHAARVQVREHREILRDLVGAVVRQHHAAGADADRGRGSAYRRQQHLGRAARDHRRVVVLGHPEARVAQRLGVAREREGFGEGRARVAAGAHDGLVEDGELHVLSKERW